MPSPSVVSTITVPPEQPIVGELLPLDTFSPLSLKNKVLRRVHLSLYLSGLSSLYAQLRALKKRENAATVLMYHSVPQPAEAKWIDPCVSMSPEIFEQQMRFLAKHHHVVSIDCLTQKLERGEPIRRGTVAITFDDGYRDNLTVAAPILAKYSLPATIYLATAYVTAGENPCADKLYSLFRARSQHQLSLEVGSWDLMAKGQAAEAYQAIGAYLIQTTVAERQHLLDRIDAQLAPHVYPPRLTLSWEEAVQLRQQYPNILLGVHTANHLDLTAHPDECDLELQLSIQQFETAMGDRPAHLAFPFNRSNAEVQKQVANYVRSAVTVAEDPVVRSDTSLYALPRLEAPNSVTLLKSWTNGGFPHLSQRLLGRTWTRPY